MRGFVGGLLVAIGVLLAGTTGLCTGAVLLGLVDSFVRDPMSVLSSSPMLLIGIIPCVSGIFIARAGLRMMR